jgi:hypothetical protein
MCCGALEVLTHAAGYGLWVCSSVTSLTGLAGMPTMRLPGGNWMIAPIATRHPFFYLTSVHDRLVADHAVITHYSRSLRAARSRRISLTT